MNITITIDGELSDADKAILRAIAGDAPVAAGTMPPIGKGEPVKAKAKPGPKPKAKEAPAPEPVKEETPEPEPEPEAKEETDEVEKAVARAAELLQTGKVTEVKAVLEELGVARVSQLKPSQVGEFLEKLA